MDNSLRSVRAQELESLLKFAPVGIAFFDQNSTYIRVNEWIARHNLLSTEQHSNRSLKELHPLAADKLTSSIQNVFSSQECSQLLDIQLDIKGSDHQGTFSVHFFPVYDDSASVIEVGAVFFSHELEQSKERLITPSELKFRHLSETMPQIVWTSEPDGELDYISPQWAEYSGMSPDSDEYLNWLVSVHPDDTDATMDAWLKCIESEQVYDQNFRLKNKDGAYRWHNARAVPVYDQDNKITKWYGTSSDIQQQKETEISLKKATEQRDEFIAMLGHELRNPLAAIATHYEILKQTKEQSPAHNMAFDNLGLQIAHLTRLVDDTLDVARLTSGKLRIEKETVTLNELISQCVENIMPAAQQKGLSLQLQQDAENVQVEADAVRLTQCVVNLLHNAIKFTDEGGRITVKLTVNESLSHAIIEVIDNGIGIDPENIHTIFEAFEQTEVQSSQNKQGLGLGLAIINKIMDLHHGFVRAQSEGLGLGTSISLHIPLACALSKREAATISPELVAPENISRKKILIIEDNASVALSLELLFKIDNHEVRVLRDGQHVIEALRSMQPDIVFCDLTLPGEMKGWDIAQSIIETFDTDELPYLVALSGHTQQHHVEKSYQVGFNKHLSKPATPEALRNCLFESQKKDLTK
ncbi:MAG: ATP-binding protein [Akkermansiaceae bacterium]